MMKDGQLERRFEVVRESEWALSLGCRLLDYVLYMHTVQKVQHIGIHGWRQFWKWNSSIQKTSEPDVSSLQF